jgi:hypothetical protein
MLAGSRRSAMGRQLRAEGVPVGEVFTWLSALYFRGKLGYALRFARPPRRLPGALVMLPGRGLGPPDTRVSAADLAAMGQVEVESEAFVTPLLRDARAIADRCGERIRVVLLGSIASGKYTGALLEVFGDRLLFPREFVGRGDMSRGGLLLRAVRSGEELAYTPVAGAALHGPRPPKLPRLPRPAGTGRSR